MSARPFEYPKRTRARRHGPKGYRVYREYRPWLEDEFTFRCVYCLKRQQWSPTDIWSADHLIPQTEDASRECDYTNLVLTCQWCNSRKLAQLVPDPLAEPYGGCLEVDYATGQVTPLNSDGTILTRILKLNHPKMVAMRKNLITQLAVMAIHAPAEWKRLMGFPAELPNLRALRPPNGNAQLDGLDESYYEQKQQNRLPEVYEV